MYALNEVIEYLHEKISRVNTGNPKANAGGRILKLLEWEDNLPTLVNQALAIIQFQFTRTNREMEAGQAKLTATSTMIGSYTLTLLDPMRFNEEHSIIDKWRDHIAVGDIIIEAFKVLGFVDLMYSETRDGSYIVFAASRYTELRELPTEFIVDALIGSTPVKPLPISSPMQRFEMVNGRPRLIGLIKESKEPIDDEASWVTAINKLQQVGWKINNRILAALIDNKDLFITEEKINGNDPKELKRRSKVLEWEFITRKATLLQEYDKFYQYMEADYRGRLYYTEPFLNFQGSDIARGMFRFAEEKEMTESGLQWLAVHTAVSFNMSYNIDNIPDWCKADYKSFLKEEKLESISVDKMTIEDRITWCNEYMESILEAGKNYEFHMEAEKPVSFLACCIEWSDYQRATENGQTFYTNLPIPIDGSNNGWQHLGAISKDEKTGELVGLTEQEIQQDFYVQTAKELIRLTEDERLQEILASMPMKHIRKGISKRGSMTRAYSAGAGKIGENMWFDCRTEDFHEIYGITEADCMKLAKILVKAINNVCPGPLKTMSYLQELAEFQIGKYKRNEEGEYELSEGKGETKLSWTTPSDFNVEYSNWLYLDVKHRCSIGGKQIKHVARLASDRPDVKGFMCGISPNFVHSMDASHMALVICQWNHDFCAVHDSFATHASNVEDLVDLTKNVFIKMYDKLNYFDIIREEITNNEDAVPKPDLGRLNIQEIQYSDYFFA